MVRSHTLVVLVALAAFAAAGAAAAPAPSRTIVAPLPVRDLALTGRSVAYVADAPARLACARIGLWNTLTSRNILFDAREQCIEEGSTGQGVWDVAVARQRLLWLTYVGGVTREWTLWTATATRRTPRQLRFVARDVDEPAPIVLGSGTGDGIPYAVDRHVVYLGENGRAIFRTTVPSPVRLLVADAHGRSGVVVAALLASGEVVGLDGSGRELLRQDYPPDAVTGLGLDSATGIAVQIGGQVSFAGGEVMLPRRARMVDFAQGRVLWTRDGDLGETRVTGGSRRLVDGTLAGPVTGRLEPRGIAWSKGRRVSWRAGLLP